MILLECINDGVKDQGSALTRLSDDIQIGDIVALKSVRHQSSDYQAYLDVAQYQGARQTEKLGRFRFIPASQHAQALRRSHANKR